MKLLRIAFIAAVLPLAASVIHPHRVSAQPPDHLICYTLNDPLKFPKAAPTTADLLAQLQPDFTQRGCQIVKPIEFCVPAAKSNVVNPPAPLLDVPGQELSDDYICYLVKCPNAVPVPDHQVADQFGLRLEQKFQPFTVCAPAQKFVPPCDPAAFPHCGGTCTDGSPCTKDPSTKMCTCAGPQTCDGRIADNNGYCGQNDCPPNETCLAEPSSTGKGKPLCHCVPLPPPLCDGSPPQSAADGSLTCGERSCPNHEPCVVVNNVCMCQPPETGCHGSTAAECAMGTCTTNPNFICALVGTQCQCAPPPQDCVANPLSNGACPVNATCPPGETCKFVPTTGVPGGTCMCQ